MEASAMVSNILNVILRCGIVTKMLISILAITVEAIACIYVTENVSGTISVVATVIGIVSKV